METRKRARIYTLEPPPKRRKLSNSKETAIPHALPDPPAEEEEIKKAAADATAAAAAPSQIIISFRDTEGTNVADQIELSSNATRANLISLLNRLLANEEKQPYAFFISLPNEEVEVTSSLQHALDSLPAGAFSGEEVLPLLFRPEASFRVRPVTRASATLEGHSEALLCTSFSPDGQQLCTGGGDKTVRLWDIFTETPLHTFEGHKHWVLFVAFSPDCSRIASGGYDHKIFLWDAVTRTQVGKPLAGHKKYITSLAWEPLH